jgi:hypothetical protein
MSLALPTPPAGIQDVPAVRGADLLAAWLLDVARQCGEPALDRALGQDWPGTTDQRRSLADRPSLIERARNEARQLASEPWAKAAKARGGWGT